MTYHSYIFMLGCISLGLSFLSLTAILVTFKHMSTAKKLVVRPVACLFVCEILFSIRTLTAVGPKTFGFTMRRTKENQWEDIDPLLCDGIAVVSTFAFLGIAYWSFVLVTLLLFLLLGRTSAYLNTSAPWQHLLVWGVSTICTLISWRVGALGPVPVSDDECGFSIRYMSTYMWVAPSLIPIATAVCVLLFALTRDLRGGFLEVGPLREIAIFVIAFVVVWSIPNVRLLWRFFKKTDDTPRALTIVYQIAFALVGTVDSLVWVGVTRSSSLFDVRSTTQSARPLTSVTVAEGPANCDYNRRAFSKHKLVYSSLERPLHTPSESSNTKTRGKSVRSMQQFPVDTDNEET